MPEIKQKDIYWIAGLLEGEGCFDGLNQTSPRVRLSMTDLDVMIKAAEILGAYNITKNTRITPIGRTVYYLSLHGRNALEWMRRIYPLMGKRRKNKIDECLQAWNEKQGRTGKRKPQPIIVGPKLSSPNTVWLNLDSKKMEVENCLICG